MHDIIVAMVGGLLPACIIGVFTYFYKKIKKWDNEIHLEIMRVRILTLISDYPHSHEEIMDLFREYEKKGGNGSTKMRVDEWRDKEGLD